MPSLQMYLAQTSLSNTINTTMTARHFRLNSFFCINFVNNIIISTLSLALRSVKSISLINKQISGALHLNKLESPSPKDALCQVWLKLAQWFWRRRFLNFVNVFSLFHNYLPFGKGVVLHLKKLESPSPKVALCQVWLIMAQWFWRRSFLNFNNVFSLFHNYLPFGKGVVLHFNKIESPSPRDTLCQVWLK